jgi:hypothetical protein
VYDSSGFFALFFLRFISSLKSISAGVVTRLSGQYPQLGHGDAGNSGALGGYGQPIAAAA